MQFLFINYIYIYIKVSARNCCESNINGKIFQNNENEAKNDSNINSDVQCWLDFVFECSSRKENPSKTLKPNNSINNDINDNNNHYNESYQTSSSFYNSSNTSTRNDSYYQSTFNNNINDKTDNYDKSNINIKMKSPTSIQNLCDSRGIFIINMI